MTQIPSTKIAAAPALASSEVIYIEGFGNEQFLRTYAAAGRIGLAGGATLIDKAIAMAQRHVDDQKRWGQWSHAFFFQGVRPDGEHWVIESDLDVHRKHLRLGVQENRASKFYNESFYSSLAVMDFGVSEQQIAQLVRAGLELVANRYRYSMRELVGTLIALRHKKRDRASRLEREGCYYCSAFVGHLFRQAGLDLARGLHEKHTTPEDLFRTPIPHRLWVLKRPDEPTRVRKIVRAIRARRTGNA
jgi:hypothetical protein